MIVAMPDGWSRLGCSQWVDSPVNGDFEQYVIHDVVSHVDRNFRTIPRATSRGVTGISSGGFGAWHLGSRNPDVFGAMSLLSADSYFELTHKPWIYRFFNQLDGKEPNGPINGDEFTFIAGGLAYVAKVSGDTMTGTVTSPRGTTPFRATRNASR